MIKKCIHANIKTKHLRNVICKTDGEKIYTMSVLHTGETIFITLHKEGIISFVYIRFTIETPNWSELIFLFWNQNHGYLEFWPYLIKT